MDFDQDLEGLIYDGQEMPRPKQPETELGPFGQMCVDAVMEGIERDKKRAKMGYIRRLYHDIKTMIEDYKKW